MRKNVQRYRVGKYFGTATQIWNDYKRDYYKQKVAFLGVEKLVPIYRDRCCYDRGHLVDIVSNYEYKAFLGPSVVNKEIVKYELVALYSDGNNSTITSVRFITFEELVNDVADVINYAWSYSNTNFKELCAKYNLDLKVLRITPPTNWERIVLGY